jgi:hypothetical protein
MSGLVAVAAIAGLAVPAATGSASAAVLPAVARSGPADMGIVVVTASERISCGTAKTCFIAGTKFSTTSANVTPVALAWNGTAWRSVVVHAPKGTTFAGSIGVSCKSATYCLMVGADTSNGASGVTRPFAVSWNGKAVSAVPAPAVPSGAVETALGGVTCLAVKSCVAAGESLMNSGATRWVIDTWNGSKWTMHTAAAPRGAQLVQASGSSCLSLSYCVLAGTYFTSSGGDRALLAVWNGKTVTMQKVPVPSGFNYPQFLGVSCTSTVNCAAVGANLTTSGSNVNFTAFTENWNGKAWAATKLTWPAGTTMSLLGDVSCTYSKAAGRHCIAVGAAGTQNTASPVAFSWNGTKWSAQHVPGPAKGKASDLDGVSCLSAADCVAIGQTAATPSTSATSPIAGFWNGSAWKVTAA